MEFFNEFADCYFNGAILITNECNKVREKSSKEKLSEEDKAILCTGQVASMLLAFSAELHLKAILLKNKVNYGKTHNLYDLYKKIDQETRCKIAEEYSEYGTKQELESRLEKYGRLFEEIRYLCEDFQGIKDYKGPYLINPIDNICKAIHDFVHIQDVIDIVDHND